MNGARLALAALAVPLLLVAAPALAQVPSDALEALRKDVEKIQKDVQEIKDMLRGRMAPAPAEPPANFRLSLDGDPVKGSAGARLVLFDFTDYQ